MVLVKLGLKNHFQWEQTLPLAMLVHKPPTWQQLHQPIAAQLNSSSWMLWQAAGSLLKTATASLFSTQGVSFSLGSLNSGHNRSCHVYLTELNMVEWSSHNEVNQKFVPHSDSKQLLKFVEKQYSTSIYKLNLIFYTNYENNCAFLFREQFLNIKWC